MFYNCPKFNQPLDSWKLNDSKIIASILKYCQNFNQPLYSWIISDINNYEIFSNSGLHIDNYPPWHDEEELVDFIFFKS